MKTLLLLFLFAISTNFAQDIPKADAWNWKKYENNPVLTVGSIGRWDDVSAYVPSVLKIDGVYHMWYVGVGGAGSAIGYATSPDGILWAKYSGNPVLEVGGPGSWPNEQMIFKPEVYYDGEIFHMWYSGFIYIPVTGDVGYATSPNGKNWTKHDDNPALSRGLPGTWYSNCSIQPSIIKENDIYRMWYLGDASAKIELIGTASSSDGINWDRHIDPVMEISDGELRFWTADVVKSPEGYYYLWYTEGPWGADNSPIGEERLDLRYAYSVDGLAWTQNSGVNVIEREEGETLCGFNSVLYDEEEGTYKMWYFSGTDEIYEISYAWAENPVVTDIGESEIIPSEFYLNQNYPNPFNPTTTLKYSIPRAVNSEKSIVNLKIFDVLGKEVATLVNSQQRPGSYEVKWDATGQPSGVYFYSLTAGSHSETKKMILLR